LRRLWGGEDGFREKENDDRNLYASPREKERLCAQKGATSFLRTKKEL